MADKKGKKKLLLSIAGVAALLLLAVAIGVGVRWWQASQVPANPTPSLPKVVDDLQNLRDTADEATFDSELDKALADQSLDNDTRYLLYVQQGHFALQNSKWQEAIEAYDKAKAIKDTAEASRQLGEAYYGAGDTAKAVEFYQKAITLIPADAPRHDPIKKEYEDRIKEIEAGKPQEVIEEEEGSE